MMRNKIMDILLTGLDGIYEVDELKINTITDAILALEHPSKKTPTSERCSKFETTSNGCEPNPSCGKTDMDCFIERPATIDDLTKGE